MTDNFENTNDDSLSILIDGNTKNNTVFFTINSQKASEILGVNRTRLSQLTSQGVFPYERRKVDARSRLFYRLNDLLNYQRKSSFGNLSAQEMLPQNQALVPLLPPAGSVSSPSIAANASLPSHFHTNFSRTQKLPKKRPVLQKALDLKILTEERAQKEKLSATVKKLSEQINKMLGMIENLECALSKLEAHTLSRKKSVFRRPCSKRMFKRIK